MPNANTPFGLRPIKHKSGAPYNGAFNAYFVPASYATALFIGDPVIKTGTANTAVVEAAAAGKFGIGTLPEINKAAAGTTNRVTGVIVGFAPDPNGLGRIHNPASTARVVYVCDDPDVVFEIQADGAITAPQVGLNAVFIYTNLGSTVTGYSGVQLDTTSAVPATTVGFQMTIQRVINRDDVETTSAFTKCEVKLNNHTEVNASTGI